MKELARWRVRIDLNRCEGNGRCVVSAPDVFAMDETGEQARVVQGRPAESLRGEVETAVLMCPRAAISILEDEESAG
jgi:ferredoxin